MTDVNCTTHDTTAPIDREECRLLVWELHRSVELLATLISTTLNSVDVRCSDNELSSTMAAFIAETSDRQHAKSYDLTARLLRLCGIKNGYPHDIKFPPIDINSEDVEGRLSDYYGAGVSHA